MKKTVKFFSLTFLCSLILVILAYVVFPGASNAFEPTFKDGVQMGSVKLEGKTLAEATNLVNKDVTSKSKIISLCCNQNHYEVLPNLDAIPSMINNILTQKIKNYSVSEKIKIEEVYPSLNVVLEEICTENCLDAVSSQVLFNPNNEQKFEITPSQKGLCFSKEEILKELQYRYDNKKPLNINIKLQEVLPECNESSFEGKLNKMSEFKTSLKNSQEGRKYNVALALSKINGLVVNSGETVSFNKITGPQTLEGGYSNAIVILNGKFTEGVGGGICQASTTLYNACVLANLEINEVHKHTLPVGYVELAFDAMVSEGYADMVFTNTSENPIYIKAGVEGDAAFCEIYGKTMEENEKIEREFELIDTIKAEKDDVIVDENGAYSDKVLYKGEFYRLKHPKDGYEAKGYKLKKVDGKVVSREEIRHEIYKAVNGVVVEGAQDLPAGWTIPESSKASAVIYN